MRTQVLHRLSLCAKWSLAAFIVLGSAGCKTPAPASRVAEDQLASGGPAYHVWLGYRHRDTAKEPTYGNGQDFGQQLSAHLANVAKLRGAYPSLRSYLVAVSPASVVGNTDLRRKIPDAVVLTAYASSDAYDQDRDKNGNALNAAHWQLFEIGKSHQLAATPLADQVLPYKAYTLVDNGARWSAGSTSYVLAHVNGSLGQAMQRLQNTVSGQSSLKGLIVATGPDYVACLFDWGSPQANLATARPGDWQNLLGQLSDTLSVTASAAAAHPLQGGVQIGNEATMLSLNDAEVPTP